MSKSVPILIALSAAWANGAAMAQTSSPTEPPAALLYAPGGGPGDTVAVPDAPVHAATGPQAPISPPLIVVSDPPAPPATPPKLTSLKALPAPVKAVVQRPINPPSPPPPPPPPIHPSLPPRTARIRPAPSEPTNLMRPPQIAIPTPRPSPPSTQPVVLGITLADPGLLAREAGGRDLPAAVAIVTVLPGSIADIGGLKSGDWLLALGQRRTQNPKALVAALRAVERGSAVHATVLRAGRTIDVVLPF